MNVEIFKDVMDDIFDFILRNHIDEIRKHIKIENNNDVEPFLRGIWYQFVILDLASTTKQIHALERKLITLSEFIEGKLYVLNNWSEVDILKEFIHSIDNYNKNQKIREYFDFDLSIAVLSLRGNGWLDFLRKEETFVTNNEKRGLIEKNNELQVSLPARQYQNALDLVRNNPKRVADLFYFREFLAEKFKCFKKDNSINDSQVRFQIRKEIGERKITQSAIDKAWFVYKKKPQ